MIVARVTSGDYVIVDLTADDFDHALKTDVAVVPGIEVLATEADPAIGGRTVVVATRHLVYWYVVD